MPLFGPKLTKEEKELLRKVEHEAYFKAKLEQAKQRGKHKAKGGTLKTIAKMMKTLSENAAKYDKQLEKEYSW